MTNKPNLNKEIDNFLLIEEVKKRPELYDKTAMGYVDRTGIKPDRWLEVAESVYNDQYWSQMKYNEKVKATQVLQCRWQNLRSTFVKTLRRKFNENGEPNPDTEECNIKNLYFDKMMFLFKFYFPDKFEDEKPKFEDEKPKDFDFSFNANNAVKAKITYSKRQLNSETEKVLKKPKVEVIEEEIVTVKQEPLIDLIDLTEHSQVSTSSKEFFQADNFGIDQNAVKQEVVEDVIQIEEHDILENSSEPKDYVTEMLNLNPENIDQDVNFAIYLIPMLRKLPIKKKLKLQIQILKLFENQD